MVTKLVLIQLLLIAGVLAAVAASGVPTPTSLDGGQIVSADEAHRLLAESAAEFVDVREANTYRRGHVPGAHPVGYSGRSSNGPDFEASLDRFDLSALPPDRDAAVIFYSHADTSWKSYKAAVTAIRAGYRNVFWMRPGLVGWMERGYPIER